jgi:phosphatidylserine decarboxylase
MRIHKEGIAVILVVLLLITTVNLLFYWLIRSPLLQSLLVIVSSVFFLLVVWFFRNPMRTIEPSDKIILCPADGKIVQVTEANEDEYFHDKRLQVSIFMSPLNLHVNRYPVSGTVSYVKYHPGKYLVAWHPKSSLLNERATAVINDNNGHEILVRQIAGAVARRIITYAEKGQQVVQGDDLGFIRFGSRVDLFLPLHTKVSVKVGDQVKGNLTLIGIW